jgi:uncharacterized membrane protein (UPF0182 family)
MLILLVVALTAVPALVDFYVEWLWFAETGYQQVFLRSLTAKTMLGAVVFAAAFAFFALNVRAAWQLRPRDFMIMTPDGPRRVSIDPGRFRPLGFGIAGLLALVIGGMAATGWESWLFYRHAMPFGDADPILGRDVGYYMFQLPFLELVRGLLLAVLIITVLGVAGLYLLSDAIGLDQVRGLHSSPAATRHLALLVAGVLLVLAFGAYLGLAQLLTTPSGIIHGASYVDVHATIPALRILVGASLLAAAAAAAGGFMNRLSYAAARVGL